MAYGFNNDKSKVLVYPKSEVYSKNEVNAEISNVNGRISNIITSPAPTEQEIIDARRSADGTDYQSLGDAIRGQVTDLQTEIQSEIESAIEGAIETTRNINSVPCGRYYVHTSGEIRPSGNLNYGMSDMLECEPSTIYTASAHGMPDKTYIYIAEYTADKTFIQRSPGVYNVKTLTTTANTAYICVWCNNANGIPLTDDIAIQIERSSSATAYVPHQTANDFFARQDIDTLNDRIAIEYGLNLAKSATTITDNATVEADGNGYKVIATKTSNSRIRYVCIDSVTAEDVGKAFTFSADLYEMDENITSTRMAIMADTALRRSKDFTQPGSGTLSYTVTSADIGKKIACALYSNADSLSDVYSIWHNIQITDLPYATEYSDNVYTVIDYTARAKGEALRGDVNALIELTNRGLNRSVVCTATQTFTVKGNPFLPTVINCRSKFTGTQPTIRFFTSLYRSPIYDIGDDREYLLQSWVVAPAMNSETITFTITVEDGSTLTIENITAENVQRIYPNKYCTPQFVAHQGFTQMCPANTRPSFQMAGKLGYSACVANVKITSDNVFICWHDDTFVSGSKSKARDADGNPPTEELVIANMTYEELLEWDVGRWMNDYWTGTRLATLDEFFRICARYGMQPIISIHPSLSVSQWESVKSMLVKHGLLNRLIVKASETAMLQPAFNVFGEDICGYMGYSVATAAFTTFVENNHIDRSKVRLILEPFINDISQAWVTQILSAGFECSCWTTKEKHPASQLKQICEWGVTMFTDDANCQNGLYW